MNSLLQFNDSIIVFKRLPIYSVSFLIYNENGKKIKHQVIMICYNREILATKSYIVED